MSGELENAGKRGLGAGEEGMDGLRGRGPSAVWHHHGGLDYIAALDPGIWYNSTVYEGGSRFMAAWAREEENASENWQRKREVD